MRREKGGMALKAFLIWVVVPVLIPFTKIGTSERTRSQRNVMVQKVEKLLIY